MSTERSKNKRPSWNKADEVDRIIHSLLNSNQVILLSAELLKESLGGDMRGKRALESLDMILSYAKTSSETLMELKKKCERNLKQELGS